MWPDQRPNMPRSMVKKKQSMVKVLLVIKDINIFVWPQLFMALIAYLFNPLYEPKVSF